MDVRFNYGALNDDLETQANAQGLTLGDEAEILEKLHFGLVINFVHGTLTDGEYSKALARLHKQVLKAVKKKERNAVITRKP